MMRRMSLVVLLGATLALPLLGASEDAGAPPLDDRSTADAARPAVVLLVIDGGINPATADYIRDGIAAAEAQQAAAVHQVGNGPGYDAQEEERCRPSTDGGSDHERGPGELEDHPTQNDLLAAKSGRLKDGR